jgi:hypothetical protein
MVTTRLPTGGFFLPPFTGTNTLFRACLGFLKPIILTKTKSMKKLIYLLLPLWVLVAACEKEEDDPFGETCTPTTGQLCTTIGSTTLSAPATWRRIGTTNRFRIDFQSGQQNLEIDIYVPDSVLYGNTYNFDSTRAVNTAVMTWFDGTNEWVSTTGSVTITDRSNNLLDGQFQGTIKKGTGSETMTVKASAFSKLPLVN